MPPKESLELVLTSVVNFKSGQALPNNKMFFYKNLQG
jgi:hypothetical protein